jgi:hypothetical protein
VLTSVKEILGNSVIDNLDLTSGMSRYVDGVLRTLARETGLLSKDNLRRGQQTKRS